MLLTLFATLLPVAGLADAELEGQLGLEVISREKLELDPALGEEMADFVGLDAEVFAQLSVQRIDARQGMAGRRRLLLAALPLTGDLPGARLMLALREGGTVAGLALAGHESLAEDPEAWSFFAEQFTRPGRLSGALDSLDTLDVVGAEEEVERLQQDPQAARARSLMQLRLLMLRNGFCSTAVFARTREGHSPPDQLLQRWEANFADLIQLAPALEELLGPAGRQQFEAAARQGQTLVQASRAEDASAAQVMDALARINSEACNRCHSIQEHRLGERATLYDALFKRLESHGVRTDLATVGFDVWAVPGHEEICEELARIVKGLLLILGAEFAS